MALGKLGRRGGMGSLGVLGTAGTVAPVLWTPLNLGSQLVAWWDASDTADMTFNVSNVASWTDRKGGIIASQGTAASQPAWSATGLNGKPALSFVGSSQQILSFSSAGFPTGSSSSTLVAAGIGGTSGAANQTFIDYGTPGNGNSGRILGFNNDSANHTWMSTNTTLDLSSAVTWSTAPHLVIGQFDTTGGASTVMQQWIDGTLAANTTSGNLPATTGTGGNIGSFNPASAFSLTGAIQQIMVISGILSTSNRQKLEGWESYIDGKAGTNLPASNPYSSTGTLKRQPYVSDP